MQMHDYIIVGQGIAGTMLAHFLLKYDKKLLIVDKQHQQSASMVAAGVVNPITGRHFIKSWRVDELIPFALSTYRELEEKFGTQLLELKNIAMIFDSISTVNNWAIRSGNTDVKDYVSDQFSSDFYDGFLKEVKDGVEFKQSGRIRLKNVLLPYKQLLQKEQDYLEESFDYNHLEIKEGCVCYKGYKARKIIFAEGYQAIYNPYFNYLPFLPAKGDILMVRIPDYPAKDKLVKHGVFIVPWKEDIYWVGSSYNKTYTTIEAVAEEGADLQARLDRVLKIPYEVIEHKTAIRPTVRDRKPFIGQHPVHKNLYLFNGMGAKGSYLSPLFAAYFVEYLEKNIPLDKEIDIKRYFKYFNAKKED